VAETESVNAVIEKGLDYLRRRIRIDAAYLFGSQLTGEANSESDIDLAVFSPDAEKMSLAERIRLGSELALDCNLDLELHLYSSRALADARPSNFAGYIIAHGKRLI
jgi:predicted nucleotidyltransferase